MTYSSRYKNEKLVRRMLRADQGQDPTAGRVVLRVQCKETPRGSRGMHEVIIYERGRIVTPHAPDVLRAMKTLKMENTCLRVVEWLKTENPARSEVRGLAMLYSWLRNERERSRIGMGQDILEIQEKIIKAKGEWARVEESGDLSEITLVIASGKRIRMTVGKAYDLRILPGSLRHIMLALKPYATNLKFELKRNGNTLVTTGRIIIPDRRP